MKKTFSIVLACLFLTATGFNAFGQQKSTADRQEKELPKKSTAYVCPMHAEIISDKAGKCPKCGMNLVEKEINKDTYTCPMHPQVASAKEGKCPECGMKLVKKSDPGKAVSERK